MLLREEIEQSFGTGPEHQPIEELVARGRRRLLRRRAAEVVAAVAVVGVVGATYSVVAPGDGGGRGSTPVASEPDADQTTSDDTAHGSSSGGSMSLGADEATEVTLTEDGRLVTGKDVEVLDQVANPAHVDPPEYSVAVDVRIHGERQWMFLMTGPNSGGGTAQPFDDQADQTFAEWAAQWDGARVGEPIGGTGPEVEVGGDGDPHGQESQGSGTSFSESGSGSVTSSGTELKRRDR